MRCRVCWAVVDPAIDVMGQLKLIISTQLKRVPPLFDVARRVTRLWERTPLFDALARVSNQLPDVAFIQIGSNDGISVDPLREFIVASAKWHGAFVEPVPQTFQQLRRNYSYLGRRKLEFFNVAVSDQPVPKRFWRVRDDCLHEFPLFVQQIGSFDRQHVLKHLPALPGIERKLETFPVPCKTYEQIRQEAGLSQVHILHMDVEGHEAPILKSVDFGSSKPLMILFEISHMPGPDKEEVFAMLRSHGYRIQELGVDCLASLRNY